MNTGHPAPGAVKAPSGAPTHPAGVVAAGPALSTPALRILTVFYAARSAGVLPPTTQIFTTSGRSECSCR
jgi:hypothetical protein